MSYSFNWDYTLPIENIHDIVSINIVPETKAYNEGDYLSIRGHILIEGEYVSSVGNQSDFSESIPLDITLPNTGRHGDIKVDVTNFDYEIEDDEKLCLELNLNIAGYDLDSIPSLVEEVVETPAEQAPVLFTKEASISHPNLVEEEDDDHHQSAFIDTDDVDYLDFDDMAMPSNQEAIELVEDDDDDRKEKLTDKIKQLITSQPSIPSQPVVEEVEEVIVEEPVEEVVVPLQPEEVVVEVEPVVEEVKPVAKPKPVMPIPTLSPVVEESVEEVIVQSEPEEVVVEVEPVVEEVKPVAKPKPVMPIPTLSPVVEGLVEEVIVQSEPEEVVVEVEPVVEEIKPVVQPKPVMPIPTVSPVVEESVEEIVIEVEPDIVEEEEILPFPLKKTSIVEEEPVKTADKSDIFDMLYELDEEEPEVIEIEEAPVVEEEVVTQSIVTPQPVVSAPTVEPVIEQSQTAVAYDDSIANQFADGESIIKIVFVQEEETTLTDLCTKYSVTEENIYNCENLTSTLCQGDRVMINYGPYRGR